MILDHVLNFGQYRHVHNKFSVVIEYLNSNDIRALSLGKHDIIKDHVYVSIDKVFTRDKKTACLEAHKKYIDVQIIFSGIDTIGWKPVCDCKKIKSKYDEEQDIIFFKDVPTSFIPMHQNLFAIFFENDAHMPLIGNGVDSIHKAVIKIKV